jgi:hypothetical protein
MSQIPLEEMPHEIIMAYILDPENSPLPKRYKPLLDRVISMSKLLDKHPVAKNAVKFHRAKFPEISLTTAWKDFHLARRVFNSYQDFDFEFWLSWLMADTVKIINKCEATNSSADRKIIAREHANLVRLLGKRPKEPVDPHRNEKHEFYILVNLAKEKIKLDLDTLHKLPLNTKRDLTRALISADEIDEKGAAEIMNS